jgi:hypothetical protein
MAIGRNSLMSAIVRIRPDMDAFHKELRQGVKESAADAGDTVERELGEAGKEGGRKLARGVKDGLGESSGDFAKAGESAGRSFSEGASRMAQHSNGISDSWGRAGKRMTVGLTVPIGAAFVKATKEASDLGEATNAVQVIFGDASSSIIAFADAGLENVGLSRKAVLEMAVPIGAMMTAQGVASEDAAKYAEEMIQRVRDVKSLYNAGSTEEVMAAFASGLRGEAEPLRKYGINLSATRIEAEALSMGLVEVATDTTKVAAAQLTSDKATRRYAEAVKKYGAESHQAKEAADAQSIAEQRLGEAMSKHTIPALTEEQKLLAAQSIIMTDSAVAAGDYAATKGSVANQTELLNQSLLDAAATFGEHLLPHAVKFLEMLNGMLETFGGLSEGKQKFILLGAGILAAIGPVVGLIGNIAKLGGWILGLVAKWTAVTGAANAATTAQLAASTAGGGAGALGGVGKVGKAAKLGKFAKVGGAAAGKGALAVGAGVAAYELLGRLLEGIGYHDWLDRTIGTGNGSTKHKSLFPGLADGGTVTRTGTTLVGERGPELLNLPRGSEVRPLDRVGNTVTINVSGSGDPQAVARAVARELERLDRRTAATVGARRLP